MQQSLNACVRLSPHRGRRRIDPTMPGAMTPSFHSAGLPGWNLVRWVLRSAVVTKRRASGGNGLTTSEINGVLTVDRQVVSLVYSSCMIGVVACGIVGAPFLVAGSYVHATVARAVLIICGSSIVLVTASIQVVVLVWFTSQRGSYKHRSLRTSAGSLKRAGISAWLLTLIAGVVLGSLLTTSTHVQ